MKLDIICRCGTVPCSTNLREVAGIVGGIQAFRPRVMKNYLILMKILLKEDVDGTMILQQNEDDISNRFFSKIIF